LTAWLYPQSLGIGDPTAPRFLGKDDQSPQGGGPSLWDDGDSYVIQGWKIDPAALGELRLRAATIPWTRRFLAFDAALDRRHPAGPRTTTWRSWPFAPTSRGGRHRAAGALSPGAGPGPASRRTWKHPTSAPAAGTCVTAAPVPATRGC